MTEIKRGKRNLVLKTRKEKGSVVLKSSSFQATDQRRLREGFPALSGINDPFLGRFAQIVQIRDCLVFNEPLGVTDEGQQRLGWGEASGMVFGVNSSGFCHRKEMNGAWPERPRAANERGPTTDHKRGPTTTSRHQTWPDNQP